MLRSNQMRVLRNDYIALYNESVYHLCWSKTLNKLKKNKISVKILITSIYCVGWFSKFRNKQILFDKDTWWKFGRDKVPRGDKGLGKILSFKVKGERWDLIPGEESKFHDGRGKLVTFQHLW